jgi:hypothetical protein
VAFVSPERVEPAWVARPRRTGQRNRPATARPVAPIAGSSVVQETREARRSLDDVALLYELGNLVPVHWASWQVEVVRHPPMTGDVLRQAEPLGVSGDELLVFSRCRSDAEADAPVAVLVDDEPREVLLADEEASVRRVPIVHSCFWKGQADVRRAIEQLWFHRPIIDETAARRAPPTAGSVTSAADRHLEGRRRSRRSGRSFCSEAGQRSTARSAFMDRLGAGAFLPGDCFEMLVADDGAKLAVRDVDAGGQTLRTTAVRSPS